MCPQPSDTESLSAKSHVEEFPDSQPDLFLVLTEEEDRHLRWRTFTIPAHVSFMAPVGSDIHREIKFAAKVTKSDTDGIDQEEDLVVNCTVAYMSQCMSWNKCKSSCRSMGASSYRWFHDGCCECVGPYCLQYGINDSRCLQCPNVGVSEPNQNLDDEDEEGDDDQEAEEFEDLPEEEDNHSNTVDRSEEKAKSEKEKSKSFSDSNTVSKKSAL